LEKKKEGVHGGTMGSPVLKVAGVRRSLDTSRHEAAFRRELRDTDYGRRRRKSEETRFDWAAPLVRRRAGPDGGWLRRRRRRGRRWRDHRRRRRRRQCVGPARVVVCTPAVQGLGRRRLPDRVRPAEAGRLADPDGADGEGDRLRPRPAGLEGRQVQDRLPGLRRLDGPARQVGPGQVQRECARLCVEQQVARRSRHVQLRVRRDRDPGDEPGSRRRPPAALAREHLRLPDGAVCG